MYFETPSFFQIRDKTRFYMGLPGRHLDSIDLDLSFIFRKRLLFKVIRMRNRFAIKR